MIQSILFFVLGALCTGFLGLAIAPAALRRASALTKKRIEASMPLTLNEIQARNDRARAEAALSIRRLEITAKALKDKSNGHLVEISRNQEELKRLNAELAEKSRTIETLEARVSALEGRLQEREGQVAVLSGKLNEAEDLVERKDAELDALAKANDEISLMRSGMQIELAGRETEIERQSTELSRLRAKVREMEQQLLEASGQKGQLETAMKTQTRRAGDLEKKMEKMLSRLADLEEALERRERELARLRERRGKEQAGTEAPAETSSSEAGSMGGAEAELTRLSAERDRLESRLTALTRENKKLRTRLGAPANGAATGGQDASSLREQIHQLAAQVVVLTATLDGPGSPISKALAARSASSMSGPNPSLADRVRALQASSSAD